MKSFILLSALFVFARGYVFECLDKCECDTKDEVIHCHNGQRSSLHLPENERLRGFHAIGLTFNDIEKLPAEDEILEKFPDVLAIDVERNPRFDCASILDYRKVKIISDCYKNVSDVSQIPMLLRPTQDCDIACTAQKHYEELHKYVLKLWEVIKEKYRNFDKDETLKMLKAFFIETIQKLNHSINKSLEEYHPRNQKQVINSASPAPTLELVTESPQDTELD